MPKTFLVTGATGFIGAHLVREICRNGGRARILSRQPSLPGHLTDLQSLDIEFARGDLLDPDSFRSSLDGVEGVFHLAGYISTRTEERSRLFRLNRDVTINLLQELARKPVRKTVYLASIFALSGGERTPANEDTPYNLSGNPVTYFAAKREAELAARKAADGGMPIVFSYPCYCLGPGDALISSSLLLLMFLRRKVPAYFLGGWNVMDVRDAARGLWLSMEKGEVNRRYLFGGVNLTFREFFQVAARVTGLPAPRVPIPNKMARVMGSVAEALAPGLGLDHQAAWIATKHWYYDDSRARRELGHQTRPLEETLRDATQWFREYGFVRGEAAATAR